MSQTRILVVEDSVTIGAMLETLLERDSGLEVVGMARNAAHALEMIEQFDPHIITLDVALPDGDGMQVLDRIMASRPRPVIMISSLMREGDPLTGEALAAGAIACFDKSKMVQQAGKLVALIRTIAGRSAVQSDLARAA